MLFAGTNVSDEIYKQLAVADVVLLLVSPDFMASDYCFSLEMAEALRKYEANQGLPIPIIVRPELSWKSDQIGQHLALPRDGKAISKWSDPDDAWEDVSHGLQCVLEDLARHRGLRLPS
jgi:internalin A